MVAEYQMTSSQPEITCGFTSVQMGLWRSEALRCHIPHMILRMVSSLNHIPPETAGRRQAVMILQALVEADFFGGAVI